MKSVILECFLLLFLITISISNGSKLYPVSLFDKSSFISPYISLRETVFCTVIVNNSNLETYSLINYMSNYTNEDIEFSTYVNEVFTINETLICLNLSIHLKNAFASGYNLFFLTHEGNLWMSGSNKYGQLGLEDNFQNQSMTLLPNFKVKDLCAMEETTIIITNSYRFYSSGRNQYGQLGLGFGTKSDGSEKKISKFHEIFLRFNSTLNDATIKCGSHSAYVLANHKILSWGRNDMYQLGDGTSINQYVPMLMNFFVEVDLEINLLAVGTHEAYALDKNQDLWAWGRGYSGQLGLFYDNKWKDINQDLPMKVIFQNTEFIINLVAGDGFLFILTVNGNVFGIGNNLYGQLGINISGEIFEFQSVPLPSFNYNVTRIYASNKNSYLISKEGHLLISGFQEIIGNSTDNKFGFENLDTSPYRIRRVVGRNSFIILSGEICGDIIEEDNNICGGHGYCGFYDKSYCACQKGYSNQFNLSIPGSSCIICPQGYYSAATDNYNRITECVACPLNTYSDKLGAWSFDTCLECPKGYIANSTANTNISDCILCPKGTYAYLNDSESQCISCPIGTWSNVSGAYSSDTCTSCPKGTYQPFEGQDSVESCLKCPFGTWNDKSNSTSILDCTPCPMGTSSNIEASISNSTCILCPEGSYSSTNGSSQCTVCPQFLTTFSVGATSSNDCRYCDLGYFSKYDSDTGFTQCIGCYIGTYSITVNATDDSACIPCEAGTYSYEIAYTNHSCIECPSQTYSKANSSSCTLCPTGTYASKGASECTSCPPGKIIVVPTDELTDDINFNCGLCPAGTWTLIHSNGSTECVQCHSGTYSSILGAENIEDCTPCPKGTYSILPSQLYSNSCIPCPKGTWNSELGSNSLESCNFCPSGTYNEFNGSESIDDCIKCPSGTYNSLVRSTSIEDCTNCPAGYFNPNNGSTNIDSCEICPAQTYSSSGSSECMLCPKGFFTDPNINEGKGRTTIDDCIPCFVGYYFQIDLQQCEPCQVGTFSTAVGANSSDVCEPCSIGTYNDIPGSSSCKKCPQGTWSSVTAATSLDYCQKCPSGTFSIELGANSSTTCLSCQAGTYQDTSGSNNCTSCPSGTYSNLIQSNSLLNCIPCGKGYYNPISGATDISFCTLCPLGTYNDMVGMTSINDCIQCPSGTYNEASGSDSISDCLDCPNDHYNSEPGLSYCLPCPDNHITDCLHTVGESECLQNENVRNSISSCRECSAGSYMVITSTKKVCTLCPPGYFSESIGMVSNETCKPCPKGTYMSLSDFPSGGASSSTYCILCQSGTFNDIEGSVGISSCKTCPSGTFSSSGSSECLKCPAGTASSLVSSTSSTSCSECPAGTWSGDGFASCIPCSMGYYNPTPRSTNISYCIPCPSGTYNNFLGAYDSSFCIPCGKGKFSNSTATAYCSICEPGTISYEIGSISCETCPKGTFSLESSSECTPCNVGTYSNIEKAPSRSSCIICPENTFNSNPGSTECFPCSTELLCPKGSSSKLPNVIYLLQDDQFVLSPSTIEDDSLYNWIKWGSSAFFILLYFILLILFAIFSICTDQKNYFKLFLKADILFNMSHETLIGKAPDKKKTRLGGLCSITAIFGFIIVIIVIISDAFFFNEKLNHTFKLVDSGATVNEDVSNDASFGNYRASISIVGSFPNCNLAENSSSAANGIWIEVDNLLPDSSYSDSSLTSMCEPRYILVGNNIENCYCEIICKKCKLIGISQTILFSLSKEFATRFAFELVVPHYVPGSDGFRSPFLLNGTVISQEGQVFFGTQPVELFISTFETQSISTPNFILDAIGRSGTTRTGLTSQLLTVSHGDSPAINENNQVLYDDPNAGIKIQFSLSRSNLAFIEQKTLNQSLFQILANLASLIGTVYTITGLILLQYEKCVTRMKNITKLAIRVKNRIANKLNEEKEIKIEKIPRNKFKEQNPWNVSEVKVPEYFDTNESLPIEPELETLKEENPVSEKSSKLDGPHTLEIESVTSAHNTESIDEGSINDIIKDLWHYLPNLIDNNSGTSQKIEDSDLKEEGINLNEINIKDWTDVANIDENELEAALSLYNPRKK